MVEGELLAGRAIMNLINERRFMQTQPYCLRNGWIVNADTGKPIARLDRSPDGTNILVFPGHGAITVDNIVCLINQIDYVRARTDLSYIARYDE